jgi:glycosyltransferase involved in cell wall biosynthesis
MFTLQGANQTPNIGVGRILCRGTSMFIVDASAFAATGGGPVIVSGPLERLDAERRQVIWQAIGCRAPARRRPVAAAARLLSGRVDVLVAQGLGWGAAAAGLYRAVRPRCTLVVMLAEPPTALRLRDRLALRMADAVLADGDAVLRAVSAPGFPARSPGRIGAAGMALPPRRERLRAEPAGPRRIAVLGPLAAHSGTPELLAAVAAWAEAGPKRRVELAWAGRGDLAGVLAAQPLPPGLTQRFLAPEDAAAAVAGAELAVVPGLADGSEPSVQAAFAAGLPVLGSRRRGEVRRMVTDAVTGWLYDPARPGELDAALARALATPPAMLARMGAQARAALEAPALGWTLGAQRRPPDDPAPRVRPVMAAFARRAP